MRVYSLLYSAQGRLVIGATQFKACSTKLLHKIGPVILALGTITHLLDRYSLGPGLKLALKLTKPEQTGEPLLNNFLNLFLITLLQTESDEMMWHEIFLSVTRDLKSGNEE